MEYRKHSVDTNKDIMSYIRGDAKEILLENEEPLKIFMGCVSQATCIESSFF